MDQIIKEAILTSTHSREIQKTELIQPLWNNYGGLYRVYLGETQIILKLITFPTHINHPKGWNSNTSHNRKVNSYKVEMNWYKNHNQIIKNAYSPRYISSGETPNSQFIILEDLETKSFISSNAPTHTQIKMCLKWLAHFHTHNLQSTQNDLWEIGTYWHLKTRPDEFNNMADKELKNKACAIDEKLNNAQFKTLVHGDAKFNNFLFNKSQAAAVDFQYIGSGVGIKDIAYFLSSVYNESELFEYEAEALEFYFNELEDAYKLNGHKHPFINIKNEWLQLYTYAWADFYRFLNGWSPEHKKVNTYSKKITQKVLDDLK